MKLTIIAASLLAPFFVLASGSSDLRTEEQFRRVGTWTNVVPRAFVKSGNIRVYFTNAQEQLMFKGSWKRSRIAPQDLTYHAGELALDTSPPKMPAPGDKWSEVRVLDRGETERFTRLATERMAPTQRLHGVYCQFSLGDLVLFRNASNQVKLVRFEDKPTDVEIEGRVNRH